MVLVDSMYLLSDNSDQIHYHVDYLTMECGQPSVRTLLQWIEESGSLLVNDEVTIHGDDGEVYEYTWDGTTFKTKSNE